MVISGSNLKRCYLMFSLNLVDWKMYSYPLAFFSFILWDKKIFFERTFDLEKYFMSVNVFVSGKIIIMIGRIFIFIVVFVWRKMPLKRVNVFFFLSDFYSLEWFSLGLCTNSHFPPIFFGSSLTYLQKLSSSTSIWQKNQRKKTARRVPLKRL